MKTERELIEALETLVDGSSLAQVVDALASVTNLKAVHIVENWQDNSAATPWDKARVTLYKAGERINQLGI